MNQKLGDFIKPSKKFGISIVKLSEFPPPTSEDLTFVGDPEAANRREIAQAWKEERESFNKLKRLARRLGIKKMIVAPESATTGYMGFYLSDKADWTWGAKAGTTARFRREWGLSSAQTRLVDRVVLGRSRPVIFINRYACFEGASRILAHEMGHHIFDLAGFTSKETNAPVSSAMRRFFPHDTYVQSSRDEICAECFALYLTGSALRKGIRRHCVRILRRVRHRDKNAVKLLESQRRGARRFLR